MRTLDGVVVANDAKYIKRGFSNLLSIQVIFYKKYKDELDFGLCLLFLYMIYGAEWLEIFIIISIRI